jgi:hypothetical protein
MKLRAILLAVLITATSAQTVSAPSAGATMLPNPIGPDGTEVRRDIIEMGFGCTKIKDSKFTCTNKSKKVRVTANLLEKDWGSLIGGKLIGMYITSNARSGQPWLTRFTTLFLPDIPEYEGINVASWVYQSCLKDESSHLGAGQRIRGRNFYIEGSEKSCTLTIRGNYT